MFVVQGLLVYKGLYIIGVDGSWTMGWRCRNEKDVSLVVILVKRIKPAARRPYLTALQIASSCRQDNRVVYLVTSMRYKCLVARI